MKILLYMENNKRLFIAYIFLSILVGVIGAIIPLFFAQCILKIQNELWLQLIVVAFCYVSMKMLSSAVRSRNELLKKDKYYQKLYANDMKR